MNEQDTIGYTKEIIKDTMVAFLFEQADEVTYASMEQSIISKLLTVFDDMNMDIDFGVAVNGDSDDNIGVKVALYDINEDGTVLIKARYADCPVFADDNNPTKAVVVNDDATVAFNYAMEIV